MKINKKILEKLIKEEVKALLAEQGIDPVTGEPVTIGGQDKEEEEYVEDDYRIGDLPTNKVMSVDQAVPQIMKEIQKIKTRLRKLEESNRKNVGNEN